MKKTHAVLLAAALLFLWHLGGRDLWAPDEPYFAEGAREMVVDGQWAVPHVNGVVTTDKPPLFFWLIALFSLPFGAVSEWTARLPSALAGLATVALTMRMGHRWYGRNGAALAGALLMTTMLFWLKSRWSQTDALLCCLIWVALSAFVAFRDQTAGGRGAGLLFWLAAALAVLTKGPVGLLLPLGITLSVLVADRELGRWRRFAPFSGPFLFAVVVGAWMVLATIGGQGEYSVLGALREHFVDRGIQGMHHKQPPWYFFTRLPAILLPWTGLLPGALVLAWRRRHPGDRFVLVATLFVLAFFSISTEKRELYLLPALPAFALMMAGLVAAVCKWGADDADRAPSVVDRRWLTLGHGAVAALLVVVAVAMLLVGRGIEEVPYVAAVVLAATFAAAGVGSLYFLWRGRLAVAVVVTAAFVALALLVMDPLVVPGLEPEKSARPFALRIKEATAESRALGLPVLAYALDNLPEPFAFYSDGVYTVETVDPGELGRHLERPEAVFAVVNGERLDTLPARLAERLYLVDSTRLARRDVLLVTNTRRPGARPLIGDDRRE